MKAVKITCYVVAFCVAVVAVVLFSLYTVHAPMAVGEGGEALGWILGGSMVPLFVLFVMRLIFFSKKTAFETKKKLAPFYSILNQFHMPIGSISVALLFLHFVMVFDVTNPSWVHFVTGYILAGLMLALVVFGIVAHNNKTPARKYLTLCHQIDVALLIVTFIVHLILK